MWHTVVVGYGGICIENEQGPDDRVVAGLAGDVQGRVAVVVLSIYNLVRLAKS